MIPADAHIAGTPLTCLPLLLYYLSPNHHVVYPLHHFYFPHAASAAATDSCRPGAPPPTERARHTGLPAEAPRAVVDLTPDTVLSHSVHVRRICSLVCEARCL